MTSTGMLTDRYELTMLSAFVEDGSVDEPAVFECFGRRLSPGRRYGVAAGLGRLVPLIESFGFTGDEVAWLATEGVVTPRTAEWLREFRFSGDVHAVPEGDLWFPGTPLATVTGGIGESLVLETLLLSVLNFDCAVASAAARMTTAARGRPIIEMGSRRAHEWAAVAAARAAYVAGFGSTSNLAAGREFGLATVGTAAHAFILAHRTEAEAFASQVAAQGVGTTLLVDTYEIEQGIRTAIEVAGTSLGAVRLDSGDLSEESRKARDLLDSLGATRTKIVVTSDLDEYVMTALADAPIDAYGVGTRVVTGSGHPTAGLVYKLVAIGDPLRPVEKRSSGKASHGGRKWPWREYDADGRLRREVITRSPEPPAAESGGTLRPVHRTVISGGVAAPLPTLDESRATAAAALRSLPPPALEVAEGGPAVIPTFEGDQP